MSVDTNGPLQYQPRMLEHNRDSQKHKRLFGRDSRTAPRGQRGKPPLSLLVKSLNATHHAPMCLLPKHNNYAAYKYAIDPEIILTTPSPPHLLGAHSSTLVLWYYHCLTELYN